ncbi:aldehyde dehydrogenase [Bergeriella denitrificans]|uniref:Putative succinate-semialdehyde dehydrogenase n=1 Tax=Bergeriella denitrificans TaxID=494 RepID=A0A378UJ72_BERDE|nr:aldehyde dehydrogenase [Bergeriella denitrificans]STZ77428.1 putative succinate-semialdehyde dehydrogenase [Bergeriella denitrificans]
MKTAAEVFQAAASGSLRAGHLIPNHADGGARMENRTPIDNSLIGYVADGDEADAEAAVSAARASFESGEWSQLPPSEHRRVLLAWTRLVEEHAEELAALDCIDAGKPIGECRHTDLPATLEAFYFYAEYADKSFGKTAPAGGGDLGLVVYEPVGVVAVVLPWNFPAQMFAWKVLPALAAGNSVIVKPSELTSLSAYRMVRLAHEAGVPEGALTLVCGTGEKVGRALGLHHDVDMAAFTGSTEVGRYFLEYSAQSNLKEIVLECGGKSPQIVFADADLDQAVPSVLAAAFWNMGENCSCGSRLIVDERIKDELLARLSDGLKDWKPGDPRDESVRIGPLVEQAHFDKVVRYLETAVREGGRIAAGGGVRSDLGSGWYVEPTVVDGVRADMTVFREEIFGPVLAVTTFGSEEEAVALANDSDYGLAASFYTSDLHRAHRVARKIRAGTVSVNGFSEGSIATPFGGYKQSGFGGRDKGVEAFYQYTQAKTIWFVGR